MDLPYVYGMWEAGTKRYVSCYSIRIEAQLGRRRVEEGGHIPEDTQGG